MTVVISNKLEKKRTSIDFNGNEVVPFTKQIIHYANENDYTPTSEELAGITQPREEKLTEKPIEKTPVSNALSIQEQIEQAEKNLAQLKELKKLKIAEMKAQLELLETE